MHGQLGYKIASYGDIYSSPPAGVAVNLLGATVVPNVYEWSNASIDIRALIKPGSSGQRIVSAWYTDYNNFTFDLDLNFADTAFHNVSLYFYDIDGVRAQTVGVLDGDNAAIALTSNQLLTTPQMNGGIYLTYSLRGHVKVRFTRTGPSLNPILNGIFFDNGGASSPSISVAAGGAQTPLPVVQGGSATFPITITRNGGFSGLVSFSCPVVPAGVTCSAPATTTTNTVLTVSTTTGTPVSAGNSLTLSATGSGVPNATTTITLNVSAAPAAGNAASYLTSDTATQGSWTSVHGQLGYKIASYGDIYSSPPAGVAVNLLGATVVPNVYEWSNASIDIRALIKPGSSGQRIVSAWYTDYNNFTFDLDLNFADTAFHNVSLYFYDIDGVRAQTVGVLDGDNAAIALTSNQLLTTPQMNGGIYLTYSLRGHVKVRFTRTGPSLNPILNGIFFDSGGAPPGTSLSLTTPTTPAEVQAGFGTTTTSFSVNSTNYTGPVTLTCSASINLVCTPSTVNIVPGTQAVNLTLSVATGTSAGTYPLTIGATGTSIGAAPVSTTLNVVTCGGLTNLDSTQLPLDGGATIRLQINCTPPSSPTASILWELLNSSAQVVSSTTNTASIYTFTAPANSGTTVANYTARATYVGSAARSGTFPLSVNPRAGVQIYPQGTPGPSGRYELNPGGSFEFGVIVYGPGTAPCAIEPPYGSQGSLEDLTLANPTSPLYSAFTKYYRYTAPGGTTTQINLTISCISNLVATRRDSLPFQITNAQTIPPIVTSITLNGGDPLGRGPGFSNGYFQSILVFGTVASASNPLQGGNLIVSPVNTNLSEVNSCKARVAESYPSSPTWYLFDDAGISASVLMGVFQPSPSIPAISYAYNSQCKLERGGATNYSSIGYIYNPDPLAPRQLIVTYALSYQTSYVGLHNVWGKLTITSGLESAWTISAKQLLVQ